MRISDWSSDVCSSDLWPIGTHAELLGHLEMPANPLDKIAHAVFANVPSVPGLLPRKQTILAIRRNGNQRSARLEDPARLAQVGIVVEHMFDNLEGQDDVERRGWIRQRRVCLNLQEMEVLIRVIDRKSTRLNSSH